LSILKTFSRHKFQHQNSGRVREIPNVWQPKDKPITATSDDLWSAETQFTAVVYQCIYENQAVTLKNVGLQGSTESKRWKHSRKSM